MELLRESKPTSVSTMSSVNLLLILCRDFTQVAIVEAASVGSKNTNN